jgi:hypothetical protein
MTETDLRTEHPNTEWLDVQWAARVPVIKASMSKVNSSCYKPHPANAYNLQINACV